MPRAKKRIPANDGAVYKKADDLPEDRRKIYDSILEDFDKQVNSRIQENDAAISAIQNQIRSLFRMALMQQPRNLKKLKFEEVMQTGSEPRLSVQLAAAAATVESSLTSQMAMLDNKPCGSTSKKGSAVKGRGRGKKKSSSAGAASDDSGMVGPPSSSVRQSTRKKVPKTFYDQDQVKETPQTATRTRGKMSGIQTPSHNPNLLPVITPKFSLNTPLHKSVMRTARPNEMVVSLSGSPIYVVGTATGRPRGKRGAEASSADMVQIPLGDGNTLMVPTKSPANGECPVDLDEDAERRLMAVRSQIENMLKFR